MNRPVLRPPAPSSASIMRAVLVLPLVPVRWTDRKSRWGRPSSSRSRRIRSSVGSIRVSGHRARSSCSTAASACPALGCRIRVPASWTGRALVEAAFGDLDDVGQQHRPGHRTDSAGRPADLARDGADLGVDVAEDPLDRAGDADRQHGRAGAHPVGPDQVGDTGRRDDDVGRAGVRGDVDGGDVAQGHGRVLGRPGEHQAQRAADGQPAPDHAEPLTRDRHVVLAQQLDDPARRARERSGHPEHELAEVHRVQAVGVLVGVDQLEDPMGVDVGRQRELDDEAGAGRVVVEPLDSSLDLGLAGGRRQLDRREAIPTSAQSRCLPATYAWLPGSSPTRMVPSPGRTPWACSCATRGASWCLMSAATRVPSIFVAVVIAAGRAGTRAALSGQTRNISPPWCELHNDMHDAQQSARRGRAMSRGSSRRDPETTMRMDDPRHIDPLGPPLRAIVRVGLRHEQREQKTNGRGRDNEAPGGVQSVDRASACSRSSLARAVPA